GPRDAHERLQVRRTEPRRVTSGAKGWPHALQVALRSGCTSWLLAKHGPQQMQVGALGADRGRRSEAAGAALAGCERGQLAESDRPIGLGSQRLQRFEPGQAES